MTRGLWDGAGGPSAWKPVGAPTGELSMNGVSCPTPSLCVTGSAGGIVVSSNPTSASSWRVVSPATGLPVKIKRRRFRRCRSPVRYLVGRGRHRFKVRAIAPGGARGRATAFHFRVGKLLEPKPAGSCPHTPGGPPPAGAPTGRCIPRT